MKIRPRGRPLFVFRVRRDFDAVVHGSLYIARFVVAISTLGTRGGSGSIHSRTPSPFLQEQTPRTLTGAEESFLAALRADPEVEPAAIAQNGVALELSEPSWERASSRTNFSGARAAPRQRAAEKARGGGRHQLQGGYQRWRKQPSMGGIVALVQRHAEATRGGEGHWLHCAHQRLRNSTSEHDTSSVE